MGGGGVSGALTVFVHAHLETLLEAASLALVTVCLVHHAASRTRLTSVQQYAAHGLKVLILAFAVIPASV